jgi:hypothetical protein
LKVKEGKGGGSDRFTHQIQRFLLEKSLLTLFFPLLVSGDSREESICCGIFFTDISFAFLSFAKFNNSEIVLFLRRKDVFDKIKLLFYFLNYFDILGSKINL